MTSGNDMTYAQAYAQGPPAQRPQGGGARTLFEILIIFALVVTAIGLLLALATGSWIGPMAATRSPDGKVLRIASTVAAPEKAEGVDAIRKDASCPCTVQISSRELDGKDEVLARVPGVLQATLAGAVELILLLIVRSTRLGSPFTMRNVERLRAIGAIVVGAGIVVPLVNTTVATTLLPSAQGFEFTLSFLPIFVGVAFFALAWVWREGVRLAEENAGLV